MMMPDFLHSMTARWQSLALREKQAVALGGACLALILFYVVLLSPLLTHVDKLREQLIANQKTLQFMQSAQKQIAASEGDDEAAPITVSPVEFLSSFQEQLNKAGLAASVTQMKQRSDDTIAVSFKQVGFDRLMRLFLTLIKSERVTIDQFSVQSSATPGVVDVELVLKLN